MKLKMDGNIFSFLHVYKKEEKGNFTGKPCLYLHLSDELKTETGLKFLKEVVEVTPDEIEAAKFKGEVLFYSFTSDKEIDKLIDYMVDNDWINNEDVEKLTAFQNTLNVSGKIPKKPKDQPKDEKKPEALLTEIGDDELPIKQVNTEKKHTASHTKDLSDTKTLKEQKTHEKIKFKRMIPATHGNDEGNELTYFDDDNDSDNDDALLSSNKRRKTNPSNSSQHRENDVEEPSESESDESVSAVTSGSSWIKFDHKTALLDTIRYGKLDLLRVLLGTKAPNAADYEQLEDIEVEIFYQQSSQLKSGLLYRLMDLLIPDLEKWQLKPPSKETIQKNVYLLLVIVREVEFNNYMSNFLKNGEGYIFEDEEPKKVDDVSVYEKWLRQQLDKTTLTLLSEFSDIFQNNSKFIISALKLKKDEVNGAVAESCASREQTQIAYNKIGMKIHHKIEQHQKLVDAILKKSQFLPDVYTPINSFKEYTGVVLSTTNLNPKTAANKFIVELKHNQFTVCWYKNGQRFHVALTADEAKELRPFLPTAGNVSKDEKLIKKITEKCCLAQLREELYQTKMDPNVLIDRKSLLYYAFIYRQYLALKLLLLSGADVDLKQGNHKTVYQEFNIRRAVIEEIKKEETNDVLTLDSTYRKEAEKHLIAYRKELVERENSFFRFLDDEAILKERREQVEKYLASVADAKVHHDDQVLAETVTNVGKNYKTGILGRSKLHGTLIKQTEKFKKEKEYGLTSNRIRDALVTDNNLNRQLVSLERSLLERDEAILQLKMDKARLQEEKQEAVSKLVTVTVEYNKEKAEQKALFEKMTKEHTRAIAEQKALYEKMTEEHKKDKAEQKIQLAKVTEEHNAKLEKVTEEMQQKMQEMMQQMMQQKMQEMMQHNISSQQPPPGMY